MPPTDASEREAQFQAEVRRNLGRNVAASVGHGLLGQTGMRLVNAPTFLPAYVAELAGSDLAVGIARGLQFLGMALSPVVGATVIEHRRRVLPLTLWVGVMMRVQILGLAVSALWLPGLWPLYAVWFFLALFGLFLGVQGVAFNFLVSKIIPVERRGRLMGMRNALGGITAVAVSLFAGSQLLETNALGNGYAATFIVSFVLTSIGLALLVFMREPASPNVLERSNVARRVRDLPALLRDDPAFTRFFIARALATMGRMGVPFYILYAQTQVALSGADLGLLTAAFVFAQSAGNLLWGLVADRRGFRFVFLAGLGVWMLSVGLLIGTADVARLGIVFLGVGAGLGGFQMAAQNMVLEFGRRRHLPMRIAVANSAADLVAAIGAVLGGLLASTLSYIAVFELALGCQVVAAVIVLGFVDEPRVRG
ncbi:MAG: MFS transporter [Deltaproteobacteria bacterium]|nr:MFS transporter [Deltaproteobacteria bacterium]MBW2360263.1 MFS transporter [Deltaproteobacteria bacterium]